MKFQERKREGKNPWNAEDELFDMDALSDDLDELIKKWRASCIENCGCIVYKLNGLFEWVVKNVLINIIVYNCMHVKRALQSEECCKIVKKVLSSFTHVSMLQNSEKRVFSSFTHVKQSMHSEA